MPGGDSVTRKAMFDALLLGCIPVLFHTGQLKQYTWHWGAWAARATVLLDHRRVVDNSSDPVAILTAIPQEKVASMQQTISAHAHRMHWALPEERSGDGAAGGAAGGDGYAAGSGGSVAATSVAGEGRTAPKGAERSYEEDAFSVTLRAVHERSIEKGLAEKGRALQQEEGRMREQMLSLYVNVTHGAGARDGQCKGSTGTSDPSVCADKGNASAPFWPTPRPFVRGNVGSITECVRLCERCERCRWVSYSLMLQLCTWHRSCNASRLDQRFEMFTYRSFEVKHEYGVQVKPALRGLLRVQ